MRFRLCVLCVRIQLRGLRVRFRLCALCVRFTLRGLRVRILHFSACEVVAVEIRAEEAEQEVQQLSGVEAEADAAERAIRAAITFSEEPPARPKLWEAVVTADGTRMNET